MPSPSRLVLLFAFLLPASAHAFDVKMAGDKPLRWARGAVQVRVDLDDTPLVSGSARRAAEAAVATYSEALDRMAADVAVLPMSGRDDNGGMVTVSWVDESWDEDFIPDALAVTVTSYDTGSGRIHNAYVVINAEAYTWTAAESPDGCSGAFDLQSTLTHELGHVLGVGHSDNPEATMFPSLPPCFTDRRKLSDDDVRALEFLYLETELAPVPLGCAVGASRPPGIGAVLLVGLLVLARGRRALAAALGLGLLFAAPAGATTVRELSLEETGRAAVVVAHGEVVDMIPVEQRGRVYTDTRLRVAECWKGRCEAEITIRQLGGERGGTGMAVAGNASFTVGAEVVLYLRPRKDGTYTLVGMAQGSFRVERDQRGRVRGLVRDLKDLVLVGGDGVREGGLERVSVAAARRAAE